MNKKLYKTEIEEAFREDRLQEGSKEVFGFWIYILSDTLLFASLFATYAVLSGNNFGGPTAHELWNLPLALFSTLILLSSSLTSGLAMVALHRKNKQYTINWLIVTTVLGVLFVALEMIEFSSLISEGATLSRSGFLSAFFALVGTHGLHVTAGIIWMVTATILLWKRGITKGMMKNLLCLSLFWHFLDIIWIFIFTIVYLLPFV